MSFAGSIQVLFFSMQICTIGSQGGPNKMAAANFLWLQFLNNRSLNQYFFLSLPFVVIVLLNDLMGQLIYANH